MHAMREVGLVSGHALLEVVGLPDVNHLLAYIQDSVHAGYFIPGRGETVDIA
jgi:hypothetical protein